LVISQLLQRCQKEQTSQATAVISANRKYVRITSTPFIQRHWTSSPSFTYSSGGSGGAAVVADSRVVDSKVADSKVEWVADSKVEWVADSKVEWAVVSKVAWVADSKVEWVADSKVEWVECAGLLVRSTEQKILNGDIFDRGCLAMLQIGLSASIENMEKISPFGYMTSPH
jgi:hypothetical protein